MRSYSILAVTLLLVGCGSKGGTGFDDGGTDQDGNVNPNDDGGFIGFNEGGQEAAPPCVNLQCQQVACGGGGSTTVSGKVYDPAGVNPLYNVIVYVPNAPVDPITHGATCDKCGSIASGSPVVTALTGTDGRFVLKDVPVGANIPIVIQVGKWRRKFTIPQVNQCVDNPIADKTYRLPKNKSEGDMPKIALTGGCDPIHGLLQKIGIDKAEFTNEMGSGTVHMFAGKYPDGAGVSGETDAYAFWGDLQKMLKYDMIINECECSPYPRDSVGPGYANMAKYLNQGGRAFNSHYHINFFGEQGKADGTLYSAANWKLWGSCGSPPYMIDTTFPKGKAMSDWMHSLFPQSPQGQVAITSGCMVRDILSTVPSQSQRWIYEGNMSSVGYISINTPTNVMPDQRCGRAVLTDLHVGTGGQTITEQEAALEFMLFDLSSCVQDDQKPPAPPPPK
jgi:hypothetical protein